jgi:hypothetical protein
LETLSTFIRNNKSKLNQIDSKKWKTAITMIINCIETEISCNMSKTKVSSLETQQKGAETLQKSVGPQFKSIISDFMETERN